MSEAPELLPPAGTLADLPMAELLARLDRQTFSGTLEVTASHRRNLVVLDAGRAAKVQLSAPIEMLGRLLIERGDVGAAQVETLAARQAAGGGRLGDLLVAAGAADRTTIDRALAEQLRRRLLRLFLLPEADWRLVPDTDLLAERGGAPQSLDLLAALAEGVRTSHAVKALEDRMTEVLAGRLATVAPGPALGRLALTAQEQSACRYLARGTWDAKVFRAVPVEHRHTLLVAAYCLHITGQLAYAPAAVQAPATQLPPVQWPQGQAQPPETPSVEPPVAARPSVQPARPPQTSQPPVPARPSVQPARPPQASQPPVPARPSVQPARPPRTSIQPKADQQPAATGDGDGPGTAPADFEREICALHEGLAAQSHYELLGVAPEVTAEALKNAYLERVKRYHPDRAVRHGLAGHQEKLEAILLQVREAYETLSVPESRAKYDARLQGRAETTPEQVGEMVDRALAAERAYQMAVMLERQHRLEDAQQQADEAVRLQPEQGEFQCMALWLQAARRPASAAVADLVPAMIEAASRVLPHERAQMQAARLLQRAGRHQEALEHFRRVLRRNPQNVDAAREVRLVELRQAKQQSAPAGGSGLFGRLFGKKDK